MARINRSASFGKTVRGSAVARFPKRSITQQNGEGAAAVRYRSATSGRFVSQAERVAAARARVTADVKRGVETDSWIVKLAQEPN